MKLNKPDPPIVGKVTHTNINLDWSHVSKQMRAANINNRTQSQLAKERYKYSMQELSSASKKEWGIVYSGFGTCVSLEGLQPFSEHTFRLCILGDANEKSEYSAACVVRTTKEPLNGEAFQKAIILDQKSNLEKMLVSNNGPKFLEIPDKFGNMPLMIAIIRNNYDIFEMLIEHGADVNLQNDSLKTPLMIACFYGRINFIKELRANNASYELRDKVGMYSIHYAVDGGNVSALEYILMDGAETNVCDKLNGWTPLLRAASVNCQANVASMLIRHGADINVMDKEKKNALLIATINGNLPLVKLLVEKGANFETKNGYGKSLYDLAVSMDRKMIVKYYEEQLDLKKDSRRK